MFGNKRLPVTAILGGLMALIGLAGCGREPSVASKSAAAFKEAQARGETFGGGAQGHGAMTPGGGHEMADTAPEGGTAAGHSGMPMEGMDHSGQAQGGMDHSGMTMKGMDHSKTGQGGMDHSRMAQGGMDHSGTAMKGMDHSKAGQSGMDHSGTAMKDMDHSKMGQGGMDHSGMAMGGMDPTEPVAVAASPGQPVATLRPDALDAPAATSAADAQRSAEMAQEMAGGMTGGGHGGHGAGTYRQVDAGRGPGAHQGLEPPTPGAGPHQHGGSATPPPSGQEGDHSQHEPPGGEKAAAAYVCPMHPEVTSETPGKCPKCGMTLVKRRKG